MHQEPEWGGNQPWLYPLPKSAEDWEKKKPLLRARLWRLLGDLPAAFTPCVTVTDTLAYDGFQLERFQFENGAGQRVYGYMAVPDGRNDPGAAVLYHHYHGDEYDNGKEEILKPWITVRSPAAALTKAGYVVAAIDACGFGQRQHQGPGEKRENGERTEAALFKHWLWQGKTLWGMMVRDDWLTLNYLLSRTDIVDSKKVGAMGMSMGSTRTWWLAALDERIQASVCIACLTRYQSLIQAGALNQHGMYYYVPGVLPSGIDIEAIVALAAPRPMLTLTGGRDAGSPLEGVRIVNDFCTQVYRLYERESLYRGVVYANAGHVYTPEMWTETMRWFQTHLQ